ncbi:GIY-YIG nuclease family protein [Streptomyces sp. AS02]|uniref:GIY-YIG nuclease family protein n=1 Tax=Streptomyces sp. AS02 TaxID=2938946 RepID=UPI0020229177|nr:GIY-YIG nuclease family protein [Streptomyces sp. AS02]MCL8016877.1 GntR family transcriptional regulator [Streptomyces sp. AS02]
MSNHEEQRTALYRLYDADDVLLYLGITWNPDWRWGRHKTTKHWAHLVTRRTIQWFPDRSSALAAEKTATAVEKPLHDGSWRHGRPGEEVEWRDPDGQQVVIASLTAEIEEGEHSPGDILQTGPVGRRFGVARATASIAMSKLAERGLLKLWYHGRYVVQEPAE